MTAPSVHDLLPLVRAALGHAIVSGDGTPLKVVAGADVSRIDCDTSGRLWSACSQAGDGLDPLRIARETEIDPAALASVAGCPEMTLYGYKTAVSRLAAGLNRRLAAEKAEQLSGAIATGDGVLLLADIQRLLAEQDPKLGRDLDLTDWRESPGVPWTIRNLAVTGSVTIVSAKGGAGKSLLLLDLMVRVAAGEAGDYLGAFGLPGTPLDVLYIEAENGARRIKRRIRELAEGDSFPPGLVDLALAKLHVRPAEALTQRASVFSALPQAIRDTNAQIVVIDPLRAFLPADLDSENDNVAMGRVLDDLVALAKQQNVAILILNHDNKSGSPNRGASAIRDSGEIIWHLTQPSEDDPDYLELKIDKPRDPVSVRQLGIRRVCGTPHDDVYPLRFEPAELLTAENVKDDTRSARWRQIQSATQEHYDKWNSGASERALQRATGVAAGTLHRDLVALVGLGLLYRPNNKAGVYPPSARV